MGPIDPGRWQFWQERCRIGATSRVNVISLSCARTERYGEYRWGPMTWTYGCGRLEDLQGPSPGSDSNPIRMRTFQISRQRDMLIVDGERLRWEYDVPWEELRAEDQRRPNDSSTRRCRARA